jgi:hypothetical protein
MPIVGKARQLIVHATSCGWLEPAELGTDMREKVLAQVAESNKENVDPRAGLGLTPSHVHRPLKRLRTAKCSYNQIPGWSPEIQKEFDEDFVRLLIANGSAWRMADNPQTKIWMEKWSRGPLPSSRKKLSGAVLDAEVLKAENRIREKIVGKVGTGTCDGWKNKAKKSVVSTMLMVENEVRISAAEMMVCLHRVNAQAVPYGNS